MTKPRQLHNTYFGVICPFETPEGKPIGLIKNLAFQSQVTVSYPIQPVIDFILEQPHVVRLERAMHPMQAFQTGLGFFYKYFESNSKKSAVSTVFL